MKYNQKIYLLFAILTIILLKVFTFAQTEDNLKESEIKKYEIGGQITILRQRSYEDDSIVFDVDFGADSYMRLADNHQTEYGIGGRFTYNFNKNIALETEVNYFPVDRLSRTGRESARIIGTNEFFRRSVEPQGRKFQAVAGPKIGIRGKKFGVFGKVRPGIFYVERMPVIELLSISNPGLIAASEKKSTFFTLDVGGVVEYYPSKNTVLRFDIGDTIIRYRALVPREFNPAFTRHTFQFSTGFGFRF
ncbi:MAG: outer membrane beta-barrel protein [Pyrinomonadaceae bacterium]|nr:outer membrane beta-barrel protein [Pyrinomonadaceae bacterium]